METAVENVAEVETKEYLVDKVCDFAEDHPAVLYGALVLAWVALLVPGLAVYGNVVGRIAGKSAAKALVDAGVKALV